MLCRLACRPCTCTSRPAFLLPAPLRLPFQYVEGLEGSGDRCLTLTASRLVKMRANAADSPYTVERAALPSGPAQGGEQHRPHSAGGSGGSGEQHPGQQSGVFLWELELSYATLEGVMPLAQQMVLASRLPPVDQEEFLQVRRGWVVIAWMAMAGTWSVSRSDCGRWGATLGNCCLPGCPWAPACRC